VATVLAPEGAALPDVGPAPTEPEALIKEARDRQRRRRRRVAAAIGALIAVAGIAFGTSRGIFGGDSTTSQPGGLPVETLASLLARDPMLGVSCPYTANVTTCGRVGVAVWLKRPALAVRATVAGTALRLHERGFGGRGPTYWEGYVRLGRKQLRLPRQWFGTHPARFLRLQLTVTTHDLTGSGSRKIQLRPGWG
jgi:hypothetical protein